MSPLCYLGMHSWPRLHGTWHEPAMEPADANCTHCGKAMHSVWRTAYPQDGSRCPGSCKMHGGTKVG